MVIVNGSGGGTSGRAMAFCLGQQGWNPGSDFSFFQFRIAVNLSSLGVGLLLLTVHRTVHTLPSSFLFPIIIFTIVKIVKCKLTIYHEKGKNKSKKSLGKAHIKKKQWSLYPKVSQSDQTNCHWIAFIKFYTFFDMD